MTRDAELVKKLAKKPLSPQPEKEKENLIPYFAMNPKSDKNSDSESTVIEIHKRLKQSSIPLSTGHHHPSTSRSNNLSELNSIVNSNIKLKTVEQESETAESSLKKQVCV